VRAVDHAPKRKPRKVGVLQITSVRLRMAFVTDRFGQRFGGAESYGVALMQELAQHHDVTVVASTYDPDCPVRLPWIQVALPRGLPSWLRVLWFAARARRATRAGFDLVHSHVNGWCGDVEVAHVTPVRYRWRVEPMARAKRLLSYISLRLQTYLALEAARFRPRAAHCVVAVSDLIATQLRAAYGERDFPVIVPGVAAQEAAAGQWRTRIRAEIGVGASDTLCLMVARDPLRKGFDTAVQALRHLSDDMVLVLVGGGTAARAWLDRSPNADLNTRVRVLDELPDVRPYYAAADVCLHPKLWHGTARSHGLWRASGVKPHALVRFCPVRAARRERPGAGSPGQCRSFGRVCRAATRKRRTARATGRSWASFGRRA